MCAQGDPSNQQGTNHRTDLLKQDVFRGLIGSGKAANAGVTDVTASGAKSHSSIQDGCRPDAAAPQGQVGTKRGRGLFGCEREMEKMTKHAISTVLALSSTLFAGSTLAASAQVVDGTVKASQAATVSQTMAEAEITVVYNRPVARGRALFGNIVPWDLEWNPGADQASYLKTTADLELAGQRLPAGSYSIWATPTEGAWELMFHKDWDVFHAPYAGDDGVVVRLSIEPVAAPHVESLMYYFPVADRRDGAVALHWGETLLIVPIHVPER